MRYLIDGNNLLFACRRVAAAIGRQSLAARLGQWARAEHVVVTLVFDGAPPRESFAKQMQSADVELVFSAPRTADEVIENQIAKNRTPVYLCVVSDDKAILSAARHRRCPVQTAETFAAGLFRPSKRPSRPSRAENESLSDKPDADGRGDTLEWLKEFGFDDSSEFEHP